jgi:DNA-binding response OmpR family regulator
VLEFQEWHSVSGLKTMSVRKRILLVDDDESLRGALAEQLTLHEEFEVSVSGTGQEAVERAKEDAFDMVLLDVGLSDIHGREVCRLLRSANVSVPIIILTGADSDAEQILGLDSGANDYVTKPFRLGVLLARMRAQLRQHEQSEDATFAIGPYSFRPAAKMLLLDGEKKTKVRLTEKETWILKYLCRIGNKVVPRDVLLSEVWGYNAGVTTHTLETHIYRLRQKIEIDPSNATLLVTAQGGYRLNA